MYKSFRRLSNYSQFSSFIGEDRKICKVVLPTVPTPVDKKLAESPQTILNKAIDAFVNRSGLVSAELLWLSASLQLKNVCIANGFDVIDHSSKNVVVQFLISKFPKTKFSTNIHAHWALLNDCHKNGYENNMELKWLCNYFPSVEIFCNTLYGFHELGKRIDYDELIREVPPYMQSKIIKINYPALLNSYEMANEIVALRYDKVNLGDISEFFKQLSFMRIDWNLPKDQMIELNAVDNKMTPRTFVGTVCGQAEAFVVMDGTAYLTLMFHGQSMRILCTRGDFMKIRNGVSYELDTNVFAKITRFMGKDYVI
ncbi:hypothetical protein ACQ4LE_000012 [Meloidogyne hapla]